MLVQWFILCLGFYLFKCIYFCNIYNNNKKVIYRWMKKMNSRSKYWKDFHLYKKVYVTFYYHCTFVQKHIWRWHNFAVRVSILYKSQTLEEGIGFKICMKYESNKYFVCLVRNIKKTKQNEKKNLSKCKILLYISVLSISYDFISSFYCYFFIFFFVVVLESLLKWKYFMRSYYCNIFFVET